ncbi:hypothetical protein J3R30DRAFT_1594652 [Lentinula aciculospora]|uniref:Uncharacterized protein n=1 Tax=Lentinula aciculospora TaxID=153920 RepID=A0A9W8ZWQ5_9AGAR|nr:hypothetical protein J3R30DRAFT_1594652 [Lentinula aciculospora]
MCSICSSSCVELPMGYIISIYIHGKFPDKIYSDVVLCYNPIRVFLSSVDCRGICDRFAIVEWVQTLLVTLPAETVLLIRVNALASRRFLSLILWVIMVAQFGIVIYAMSQPEQNLGLPLPDIPIDQFHVCILYSNPEMDLAYLLCCIIFDSIVFLTTLVITVDYGFFWSNSDGDTPRSFGQARFRPTSSVLLSTIQRDGVLYFCAILSGNIIWLILSLNERPGLKFMNTQPSMIITSIMINRLTLSLRKVGDRMSIRSISENWPDWSWPSTWNAFLNQAA